MKIAIFQMDVICGSPTWNIDKALRWMEGLKKDVDLAILPETFDTGGMGPGGYERTVEIMTTAAIENGKAICFSSEQEHHNRFYFIYPDGKIRYYDKRHLYPGSGEWKRCQKGDKIEIISYKGFRILPEICYDLRFPVWSRNPSKNPYDLAIYLASWPADRIYAWDTLLRARAIENICYVAAAGRIGDDRLFHYCGHSKVIDFKGGIIADTDENLECCMVADLDKESLNGFRRNFCTFGDADKFQLL